MIAWQKRNDPSQEQAPPGSIEAAIRIASRAILPKGIDGRRSAFLFKTMQALFKQSAAIQIVQPWNSWRKISWFCSKNPANCVLFGNGRVGRSERGADLHWR
jgi:hypothetical protein